MRKISFAVTLLFFLAAPAIAFGDCSPQDYTVVFVNGILNSESEAGSSVLALQKALGTTFNGVHLTIQLAYNPSHLDGYGDELESVSQAFNAPVSEYDFDTMLDQLAPILSTQKILLVGHSQGTFYTNELYGYLISNGVSPQSISVYNIATPASFVAGKGSYLTSGNDKLINQVRVWDAEVSASQPLAANILIPLQPGDDADSFGGHHFESDYLAGAASRIVSDIHSALASLVSSSSVSSTCFVPPPPALSDMVQKTVFALADPTLAEAATVGESVKPALVSVAMEAEEAENALTQTVNSAVSEAFFSIFPRPDAQNAGTVFSVEKALYGSSLSEADYEALLNGKDIPDDPPRSPKPLAALQEPSQPEQQDSEKETEPAAPVPQNPQPVPVASTSPAPTAVPFQQTFSVSPGFGGGSPVASAEPLPQNTSTDDGSDTSAATSSPTETTQDDSSHDVSTTTAATSTPEVQPPEPQPATASCGESVAMTTGDFFSSVKDDAEYSADGYLEYHFENSKDGGFTLTWNYYDDDCDISGPLDTHFPLQIALPTGIYDWSVRFTSMTHFDVWNDDDQTNLGSYDIPALLPPYSSIAFIAKSVDGNGNHSSLTSRGLKMFQSGEPPTFTNAVAAPAGCPDFTANGYHFDPTYQKAEYVDGLLRVHLRLLAPYNDGRMFRSAVLTAADDCSFTLPSFVFTHPETSLTPFIRYYSFRMASSTHWVLWDDENDKEITCEGGCEGDIPSDAAFVLFYAIVDDFTANPSSVRTAPFPPTGP